MIKRKCCIILFVCISFVFGLAGASPAAWGAKELETEKTAVNLVREVARGSYGIVTTQELKGWIDKKKSMLIR